MSVSGSPSQGLDPSAVLNRLDSQLGEIGRRQHRFAWLREPASGDWVAVDAYYPGSRVVVVATDDRPLLTLCEDLVPRNGLFLLTLTAEDLTGDSADAAKRLRARLEIQGWKSRAEEAPARRAAPPPPPPPPAARRAPAPAPAPRLGVSPEQEEFDVPPDVRVHRPVPAPSGSDRRRGTSGTSGRSGAAGSGSSTRRADNRASQSEGIGVGVTLVVAVVLELAVGGGVIGLGTGQIVIGFAFVLDACARVLGMISASQNDDLDAAWTAVLFGSPALWGLRDTGERGDVAPVARVTAVVATGVLVLGLLIWIL